MWLDAGYWLLDAGYWLLDAGYWILVAGCWLLDCRHKYQDFKSLVSLNLSVPHTCILLFFYSFIQAFSHSTILALLQSPYFRALLKNNVTRNTCLSYSIQIFLKFFANKTLFFNQFFCCGVITVALYFKNLF